MLPFTRLTCILAFLPYHYKHSFHSHFISPCKSIAYFMADPQSGGSSSEGRRRSGGVRRGSNPMDEASPPVAPCGACKFLRRKCANGCIFAPHFTSDQGSARFAAVHKIFGASNVSKLLLHIPINRRQEAVVTISYEAQARLADPVYGCVSTILALQQQVASLQAELATVQTQLVSSRYVVANALHNTTEPPPPLPQLPLGQLQPQNNQSLPAAMASMLQQQPVFSTNSSNSNSTNLINSFNNPSFDLMAATDTHNGASASSLRFSRRQSLEDEDEEDAATFDDMFRRRR